jgi:hypothetical protein
VSPRGGPALRLLAVAALLALAAPARAAVHVLVVSGLGGEADYEQRFETLGRDIAQASLSVAGDAARVQRLSGAAATAAAVEAALAALAAHLTTGDQAIIVFIGHGSYDGSDYRLNLPGPDLTGLRLGVLLDRMPAAVPLLLVNATSASGAVAARWLKGNRVVITATKSGGERNATRFATWWAKALTTTEADRDKDETVTAAEAFDYASRQVAESFKADAAIATEHPQIVGTDPSRFVVARLGKGALYASDGALQALRGQQTTLDSRLSALKVRHDALGDERYYAELEPVLLEIATLDKRIDAREQQLAAGVRDGP